MSKQWAADEQQPLHGQMSYNPGPSEPYAPQYYPPPNQSYPQETKSPYEGDRFKPKNKVNDPIFLVLFILQVRSPSMFGLSLSGASRAQRHPAVVRGILYRLWLGHKLLD
jgi:hypothetical protein